MVWYYADGDRQRGPISDEEFQEMIDRGRLTPETLVWKDGMDNWQPLSNASEAGLVKFSPASATPASGITSVGSPSSPAIPESRNCSQCGRGLLSSADSVQLGNIKLCKTCDSDMARHYNQQMQSSAPLWAVSQPTAYNGPGISTPAGVLPFASIFSRAAAKILDNLIESVVLLIIMALTTDFDMLNDAFQNIATDPNQFLQAVKPFVIASLVFGVLYNAVLVSLFGATLGKMALGIRVVISDGSRVGASQAIIRAVVPAILQIPAAMAPESAIASIAQGIFIFGFLMALLDIQRRTLFDRIADTRVVSN